MTKRRLKDNDKTEVTKDTEMKERIHNKIDGLKPEYLLAFHESNGEFYTIESLSKYTFHGKRQRWSGRP